MKTICAWCKKLISGDPDDPDISHGICEECDEKVRKEELERLKKRKGKKNKESS